MIYIVSFVLLIGLSAGRVWALPITIENHSWEDPPLADDGQLTDWAQIPNWDCAVTGVSGIERKWYGSTDGVQCAFFSVGANGACYQLTNHVIGAGENFTLTFDSIMSWDGNMAYARLYYDDAGSRVTGAEQTYTLAEGSGTGTWETYTLSFSADNVSASVGNRIGIEFYNADVDGWIGLDNVRLDYEAGNRAKAFNPSPIDQATEVCPKAVLSWTPGSYAPQTSGHKVFFSDDFNDVNDGVDGVVQDTNSCGPPGLLEWSTTYYWRIDEVNSTIGWDPGDVWQFTVEPFSYHIENITATASSSQGMMGPEKTIDSSGLNDSDQHSTNTTDMWLSGTGGPQPVWIKYEFDRVYNLHEMWVWNSNMPVEPLFGLGFKDVTIEYSTDDVTWMQLAGVPEFNQATGLDDYAHNTTVPFEGAAARYVRITANSNWGETAQYGLSEVRFFYKPVRAREPSPAPGQANVPLDVVLGWRAGRDAATHDVYLDTSERAVREGTITPESIPGNGCMSSYAPSSLELGQRYYWKVTEVNDAQSPASWDSDVWSFSTVEYSVVDDFEDYNDYEPDRIFDTWVDGWGVPENGSQIGYGTAPFAEQTIVNGGSQSMPFFYNNTGGVTYSEAICTFDTPQDWSKAGIKTLTLYFYGDPDNNANEPMWVKLTDQSGSATVTYGSYADEDINNLTELSWHEWNILLADFGVDLSHVEAISIGFSNPGGISSGNSGRMYFDDIRLYPTRCVASKDQPCGDLNDDCVVDYLDLEILGEDWLLTDAVIATLPVSTDGLVAHWALDGNADDSSGNNNRGTLMGSARWISAGQIGGALALDGVDDYVNCGLSTSLNITDAITLSAWVKTNDTGNGQHNPYITKGDTSYGLKHHTSNGIEVFIYDGDWYQARSDALDSSFNGVWHHVAGTYDGIQLKLYIDGALQATSDHVGSIATNQFAVNIGRNSEADDGARLYEGLIDDVCIYRRALSSAEIAYLADTTQSDGQLYIPVPSAAELYSSEPAGSRSVDFKDYAALASAWLQEQLWP